MVESPAKHFEAVAAAGGDSVTFHVEAVDDVAATIRAAREQGLQAGIAFNPESEPEEVAAVAGDADLVLCMSIHPGYSGQPFREETYDRVRRLRVALAPDVLIQVDGGVSADNIRAAARCGRDAARRRLGDLRPRGHRASRTGSSCKRSRDARAGGRACASRAPPGVPEADGRRGRSFETARWWAKA